MKKLSVVGLALTGLLAGISSPGCGSGTTERVDAGLEGTPDADAPSDAAAADGCCVALPGMPQADCDAVEAFGEARCAMLNMGTSCAWSAAPACTADAGTSTAMDAGTSEPMDGGATSCCVALPGMPQSDCDAVEAFGEARCTMLNMGTSCAWSAAPMCTADAGTGSSMDAGGPSDAGPIARDGAVLPPRDGAVLPPRDGGPALRDAAVMPPLDGAVLPPRDGGPVLRDGGGLVPVDGGLLGRDASILPPRDAGGACCVARPGTAQAFCTALEALGRDRCNMINGGASCSWTCP